MLCNPVKIENKVPEPYDKKEVVQEKQKCP